MDDRSTNGRRRFRTSGLPRAISISVKKPRPSIFDVREDSATIARYARPSVREDCGPGGVNAARPCPFVSCKHHLYLDINPETGSIKINFPDIDPWDLQHSCALDIADDGGHTLEEIGAIMRLTRERARQIEVKGLIYLRRLDPNSKGSHDFSIPDPEAVKAAAARVPRSKRRIFKRRRFAR